MTTFATRIVMALVALLGSAACSINSSLVRSAGWAVFEPSSQALGPPQSPVWKPGLDDVEAADRALAKFFARPNGRMQNAMGHKVLVAPADLSQFLIRYGGRIVEGKGMIYGEGRLISGDMAVAKDQLQAYAKRSWEGPILDNEIIELTPWGGGHDWFQFSYDPSSRKIEHFRFGAPL